MEKKIITTEKMIELGFTGKPKSFKKEGVRLVKHPTMNWLIFRHKKEYAELRNIEDVLKFLNKYLPMKIKSITEYAKRHLSVEDIELLESFIGCETEYSETNSDMLIMPDGELVHKDFLNL